MIILINICYLKNVVCFVSVISKWNFSTPIQSTHIQSEHFIVSRCNCTQSCGIQKINVNNKNDEAIENDKERKIKKNQKQSGRTQIFEHLKSMPSHWMKCMTFARLTHWMSDMQKIPLTVDNWFMHGWQSFIWIE